MSGIPELDNKRRNRSGASVKADSFIRRVLGVADPWNAQEVADGLSKYYRDEKAALISEATGYPVMPLSHRTRSAKDNENTAISKEMMQAREDTERDLQALVHNSLLKDIQPELEGWETNILGTIEDGIHNAEYALDARQRDSAFAARRSLRDFARLARYIGALTPHANVHFRRLAQSLDEVSAVLLVMMGEGLAEVGISTSGVLLQTPASELEERRDAILQALRTLNGAKMTQYGDSEWPRGMTAYRILLNNLDRNGQADLRSLLNEQNMGRLLDDLVDQATVGGTRGLRSLAASAQVPLERLRRLYHAADRILVPESPAIASLLSAIRLLLDAFEYGDTASRLIFASRPPVLYYGLYGLSSPQGDDQALLDLLAMRGPLASLLDCILDCNCNKELVLAQILGDKVLHDVDHAIDLFLQGNQQGGERAEYRHRCGGYAVLFNQIRKGSISINNISHDWELSRETRREIRKAITLLKLKKVEINKNIAIDALCQQLITEDSWRRLIRVMSPSCRKPDLASGTIYALIERSMQKIDPLYNIDDCRRSDISIPATLETSLDGVSFDREPDGNYRG